jgi:hypothetical protein
MLMMMNDNNWGRRLLENVQVHEHQMIPRRSFTLMYLENQMADCLLQ